MLLGGSLDKVFWAEALSTAVFIWNCVLSRPLPNNVTPYLRWIGKTPDISYFRVFGCRCWYVIPKGKIRKVEPRSKEGIMLGYSSNSKGYKVWNVESRCIIISRDITFNESPILPPTTELPISETEINVSDQGGESVSEGHEIAETCILLKTMSQ